MGSMIEKYEFPCGMKVEVETHFGIWENGQVHFNLKEVECPLHGKNCKKK